MSGFPATAMTKSESLSLAQTTARRLKAHSSQTSAFMASQLFSANVLVELHRMFVRAKADFDAAKAVAGIGAYAQEQLSDGTLNIAAAVHSDAGGRRWCDRRNGNSSGSR